MSTMMINASAGSGKTYSLCEQMLLRVRAGTIDPGKVILTTFTVKAAGELKSRIRTRLLEEGYTDAAMRLEQARIGTVHSVCGSLLRDFAFHLGLSPDLQVADEDWSTELLQESIDRVLTSGEQEELSRLSHRLSGLGASKRDGGLDDWVEAVRAIIELSRTNGLLPEELAGSKQQSLQTLEETLFAESEEPDLLESLRGHIRASTAGGQANRRVMAKILGDAWTWSDWQKLAGMTTQALTDLAETASRYERSPEFRSDMRQQLETVFEISRRALIEYTRRKEELGVLDFADQERKVYDLLSDAFVQDELRGSIDLLMIDEFQDTSPIQLAIFLRLRALAGETILVGDPKQAIYGFRGTDPDLMRAVLAELAQEQGSHTNTLSESWRSRPGLVSFTSDLFAPAFAGTHGMREEDVRLTAAAPLQDEPDGLEAPLEVWHLDSRLKKSESVTELAERIAALFQEPRLMIRETGQSCRPVTFGDLAVLGNANNDLQLLAARLREHHIPVQIASPGLLQLPEVRLVLAGMHFWQEPENPLATAEIRILLARDDQEEDCVLTGLIDPEQLPAEPPCLETLRQLRARYPLAGLEQVFAYVCASLPLDDFLLRHDQPAFREANLEALRGLVLSFIQKRHARQLPATLAAFLIDLQKQPHRKEGDRTGKQSGDAVVLSTLHASKGLEWPVTVLWKWAEVRATNAFGVHLQSPQALSLQTPLAGRWIRYWPNPLNSKTKNSRIFDLTAETASPIQARDRRDRLRLAYVGMTRAKSHLILCESDPSNLGLDLKFQDGVLLAAEIPHACRAETRPAAALETAPAVSSTFDACRASVSLSSWTDYPPASQPPSSMAATGKVLAEYPLGERIPLRAKAEADQLGTLFHHFCAAAESMCGDPLVLADRLLNGWEMASVLEASDLVLCRRRLLEELERLHPGHVRHVEWPIRYHTPEGSRVEGFIDLLLETPDGWILVDHKTFPGNHEARLAHAQKTYGQLEAYRQGLLHATGKPVLGLYVHYPFSGFLLNVDA
jgi:ATP-dependent helicase/nuclease subunit A